MIHPYGWSVCVPPTGSWKMQQALDLLQPDHWMNWSSSNCGIQRLGFTPTVWKNVHVASVQTGMRDYPGETWIIGNEYERPEQANLSPKEAVAEVHKFLNAGWGIDAEFNWCGPNCAINMHDYPGNLWWREYVRLLRLGGINRPSIYGVHLYHSNTRAHVREAWSRISEWRSPTGWLGSDTPIVVTEFCAEDNSLDAQVEVMNEVHATLRAGTIKGAYWYMACSETMQGDNVWPNCHLCEVDLAKPETMRLTELGKHWLSLKQQGV